MAQADTCVGLIVLPKLHKLHVHAVGIPKGRVARELLLCGDTSDVIGQGDEFAIGLARNAWGVMLVEFCSQ